MIVNSYYYYSKLCAENRLYSLMPYINAMICISCSRKLYSKYRHQKIASGHYGIYDTTYCHFCPDVLVCKYKRVYLKLLHLMVCVSIHIWNLIRPHGVTSLFYYECFSFLDIYSFLGDFNSLSHKVIYLFVTFIVVTIVVTRRYRFYSCAYQ